MIPNYPFVSVFIGNNEYRSIYFSPAAVEKYKEAINEKLDLGLNWKFRHVVSQTAGQWYAFKYTGKIEKQEWIKEVGDALNLVGFSWQVEYEDNTTDILHYRLINLDPRWDFLTNRL